METVSSRCAQSHLAHALSLAPPPPAPTSQSCPPLVLQLLLLLPGYTQGWNGEKAARLLRGKGGTEVGQRCIDDQTPVRAMNRIRICHTFTRGWLGSTSPPPGLLRP